MNVKKFVYVIIFVLALSINNAHAAQDIRARNIAGLFTRINNKLTSSQANTYAGYIIQACEKYKQDPYVIAAIIVHESTVKYNALSKGGDYGLMQVRWKVHANAIKKEFPNVKSATDMFNARVNIFYGTKIFAECMSKSTDLRSGLMRYSAGSVKLTNKVLATVKELRSR